MSQINTLGEPVYRDAKSPRSFQQGMEYQDFVCTKLAENGIVLQNLTSKKYQFEVGENLQGFEIKLDNWCTKSGRLSIEIEEKTRADQLFWTPSGIMRDDNSWLYLQGNYSVLFVFAKNWLRRWLSIKRPEIVEKETIKSFYLDLNIAEECAVKVYHFTP